jgi:hypothetical protein
MIVPCTNAANVVYNVGSLEMELGSNVASETNALLHAVISITADFLDIAYANTQEPTYDKISCSIVSYLLGGSAIDAVDVDAETEGTSAPYTAKITMKAQVLFAESTKWTQTNVTDFTTAVFAVKDGDRSFLHTLMKQSNSVPFLTNITYAAVKVNGNVVVEDDIKNYGTTESDDPTLEVWMIAVIGGLGAFVLVLCAVITCICCIPIEDENITKTNSHQIGNNGTNPTQTDSKMDEHMHFGDIESKAPSPVQSIGSQDSSLFTYNPKSVKSYDSSRRSHNSYFTYGTQQGVEMDLTAWQVPGGSVVSRDNNNTTVVTSISANQISFGQDISAIEAKKGDLSLIQEDEENESSAAGSISVVSDVVSPLPSFRALSPNNTNTNGTVHSSSPSRASGKYKSLLASISSGKSISTGSGGASTGSIAHQYLTKAAIQHMEHEDRLVELKSRGSISSSSTNSKKSTSHGLSHQRLPAIAVAPPSSTTSNHPSNNPMAMYDQKRTYHGDSIHGRQSDEDTEEDSATSYGPRYHDPTVPAQGRLHLGGSAEDVMNDLNDLSAQIDQIRGSQSSSSNSSISGRAAIRLRR